MCLHLFNPPAPDCIANMPTPCNNCHCVPRYWRLESPAYSFGGESFEASQIVLEADPVPGESVCLWTHRADIPQGITTGVPRDRADNDFFAGLTSWRLASRAGLQLQVSPLPGNTYEEWVIYKPDEVAYTLPVGSKHFQCLSPNTMFYTASAGDFEGTDPDQNGWPPNLTITPYYP